MEPALLLGAPGLCHPGNLPDLRDLPGSLYFIDDLKKKKKK